MFGFSRKPRRPGAFPGPPPEEGATDKSLIPGKKGATEERSRKRGGVHFLPAAGKVQAFAGIRALTIRRTAAEGRGGSDHPPLAPANQLIPRLNRAVRAGSSIPTVRFPLRTSSKRPKPRRSPTSKATLDEKKWR